MKGETLDFDEVHLFWIRDGAMGELTDVSQLRLPEVLVVVDGNHGIPVMGEQVVEPLPPVHRADLSGFHAAAAGHAANLVTTTAEGGSSGATKLKLNSLLEFVSSHPRGTVCATLSKLPFRLLLGLQRQVARHAVQRQASAAAAAGSGDPQGSAAVAAAAQWRGVDWSLLLTPEVCNESMKRTELRMRKARLHDAPPPVTTPPTEQQQQQRGGAASASAAAAAAGGPAEATAAAEASLLPPSSSQSQSSSDLPWIPVFSTAHRGVGPSFRIRLLSNEEQQHALGPPPSPPLPCPPVGAPSVTPSLARFRRNFRAFTGGDAQQLGIGPGVMAMGGAVLACLLPLPPAFERRHSSLDSVHNTLAAAGLPHYALSLVLAFTGPWEAEEELVAELGDYYRSADNNGATGGGFRGSDTDLFLTGCDVAKCRQRTDGVVRVLRENVEQSCEYFVRSYNAVTCVGMEETRNTQIVAVANRSMEDILVDFDVDCAAVAYDGQQVWALPRARRALNTRCNFVDPFVIRHSRNRLRLRKYHDRGFRALLYELCVHSPRCDVVPEGDTLRWWDNALAVLDAPPQAKLMAMQQRASAAAAASAGTALAAGGGGGSGGGGSGSVWLCHLCGCSNSDDSEACLLMGAEQTCAVCSTIRPAIATRADAESNGRAGAATAAAAAAVLARVWECSRCSIRNDSAADRCSACGAAAAAAAAAMGAAGTGGEGDGEDTPMPSAAAAAAAPPPRRRSRRVAAAAAAAAASASAESLREFKSEWPAVNAGGGAVSGAEATKQGDGEGKEGKEDEASRIARALVNDEDNDALFYRTALVPCFSEEYMEIVARLTLVETVRRQRHLIMHGLATPYQPRFTHGPVLDVLWDAQLRPPARPRVGRNPERVQWECYMCNKPVVGEFKDRICRACASLNRAAREKVVPLHGKVALITGCRVRIGRAAALKLLRCGAVVVGTTRFPLLARQSFGREPDSNQWMCRLFLHPLDLRSPPMLLSFLALFRARYKRVDFIINNAAQTIRRPPAYYRELLQQERALRTAIQQGAADSDTAIADADAATSPQQQPLLAAAAAGAASAGGIGSDLNPLLPLLASRGGSGGDGGSIGTASAAAEATQLQLVPGDEVTRDDVAFPPAARDHDGQPLDMRELTTWNSELQHVSLPEMLEVQLVNVTAPFTIVSQLLPLLQASADPAAAVTAAASPGGSLLLGAASSAAAMIAAAAAATGGSGGSGGAGGGGARDRKFVINVSSPEGQFHTEMPKKAFHPHTNMAKASLNMFTRTMAAQLRSYGTFIVSVDPGWVTDLRPAVDHGTLPQNWVPASTAAAAAASAAGGDGAAAAAAAAATPGRASRQYVAPPLTVEDGAARVLHPILSGVSDDRAPFCGVLLKHFAVEPW